jgi:hypothetical protein
MTRLEPAAVQCVLQSIAGDFNASSANRLGDSPIPGWDEMAGGCDARKLTTGPLPLPTFATIEEGSP